MEMISNGVSFVKSFNMLNAIHFWNVINNISISNKYFNWWTAIAYVGEGRGGMVRWYIEVDKGGTGEGMVRKRINDQSPNTNASLVLLNNSKCRITHDQFVSIDHRLQTLPDVVRQHFCLVSYSKDIDILWAKTSVNWPSSSLHHLTSNRTATVHTYSYTYIHIPSIQY